jgi:hypothetical protein
VRWTITESRYAWTGWIAPSLLALNLAAALGYLIVGSQTWWTMAGGVNDTGVSAQATLAGMTASLMVPFVLLELVWTTLIIVKRDRRSGR